MTIVKREGLGRPMTWGELDGNFDAVEALRTEAAQAVAQSGANANASAASAGVAEGARDTALEAAAQVENDLVRVIKAPEGETLSPLPDAVARQGTLLGFGANGQPMVKPVSDFVQYDESGNIPLPAEVQGNTRELWRRSLAEIGLTLVDGSFQDGATANSATDAVWDIDGAQCYTWAGDFPHDSEGEPGAGWVGVSAGALTRITPEMCGAKGLPHDDRIPLTKALQLANDLGIPFSLTRDIGYNGEIFIDPKDNGKSLIINGNWHTIYKLDWSGEGYRGIRYGNGWYDTRPDYSGCSLTLNNLILDGNFKEGYIDWFAPTSDKPAVNSFMMWTSAEHLVINGLKINNTQRSGLCSMYNRTSNITNFHTKELGGHAYEPGDHDAYSDPLLFRCLLADAHIVLNDLNFLSLGYPSSPMSRIGMSIQISDGKFDIIANDSNITGFERSIHIEEVSDFYTLTVNGSKLIGGICGVHTTRGAGTINPRPRVILNSTDIEVCTNTAYRAGDFQPSESYHGWVRASHGASEDADIGGTFELTNCNLKIIPSRDGVVHPVSWGGNVTMIGGSIDYNNTASQKAYGYLRVSGGAKIKGLSTIGYYFYPYAAGTRKNTIELDGVYLYRHESAVEGQPVNFGHAFNVHRDVMDYAINCTTHGLITLPINEFNITGNRFIFETESEFIDARNRSSAGMMAKTTYDFPLKGCIAVISEPAKQIACTPMASALISASYVTADAQIDLRVITSGLGAGFYTIVIAPSTSRTAVGMGSSTPPTVLGSGKLYMVFSVSNDGTVSNANATNYGRNLVGDQLNVIFTPATRTFSRDPSASSALVNIPWALYSGDVSASIFKG